MTVTGPTVDFGGRFRRAFDSTVRTRHSIIIRIGKTPHVLAPARTRANPLEIHGDVQATTGVAQTDIVHIQRHHY